ncbi:MAG: acylphosphatase [Bacteroidales bacterium]|nr:acylphosphatase [Bacteroidales bacterium]
MKKHLNVFIEGKLERADFNFYSQSGAYKYDIDAIYKNGDTRHIDLELEGEKEDLDNYIEFLKVGPLRKHIELFRVEEDEFVGIKGFKSYKVHKEELTFTDRIKKFFK